MQMSIAGWRDGLCEEHERRTERRKTGEILARWREEWQGCKPRVILNEHSFLEASWPGVSLIEKVWGRGKGRDGEVSILCSVVVCERQAISSREWA